MFAVIFDAATMSASFGLTVIGVYSQSAPKTIGSRVLIALTSRDLIADDSFWLTVFCVFLNVDGGTPPASYQSFANFCPCRPRFIVEANAEIGDKPRRVPGRQNHGM